MSTKRILVFVLESNGPIEVNLDSLQYGAGPVDLTMYLRITGEESNAVNVTVTEVVSEDGLNLNDFYEEKELIAMANPRCYDSTLESVQTDGFDIV